jgi:hypothetical protein
MRTVAALLLILAVVLPAARVFPQSGRADGGSGATQERPPPKRAKVSCAQYRAKANEHADHALFNTRLKPGSWGRIPRELQRLPRQSRLCGADGLGQVVVTSPLFGKELESHYAPLFAEIGCSPFACTIKNGKTQCSCRRQRDLGVLVTDEASEAFVLALLRRGR